MATSVHATKRKVLVVGGGAREHAIVLKLLASKEVGTVFIAPGNPGIVESDRQRVLPLGKIDSIKKWMDYFIHDVRQR